MSSSPLSDPHLTWLFNRQRFLNPTLTRTRALLAALDNPQHHFKSVLVGGTNGKGSTASTLHHILIAAGYTPGLFTSPHLMHFGERFTVRGNPLKMESILSVLEQLKPAAEAAEASFFEIVTALACKLFVDAHVDIAVMEVGLGGRFDSTNALEPALSIITGIARDHTAVLGDSIREIASEKAGIMRPQKPTFSAATGLAADVLTEQAKAQHAIFSLLDDQVLNISDKGWQGVEITLNGMRATSPLLGLHQGRNVALAMLAAAHLNITPSQVKQGVAQTHWPARLEPLPYQNRTLLLDCAHNPEAAQVLRHTLQALGIQQPVFIFGCSEDKDLAGIADILSPCCSQVVLTRATHSPRAASPEQLAPLWQCPSTLTTNVHKALAHALTQSPANTTIVAAGSVYLMAELRPLLLGLTAESWERSQ